MRKRICVLLVLVVTLFSICGCRQKESVPLTVYLVQSEALYKDATEAYIKEYPEAEINILTFESYEEVNERLKTELMSGEGPDVLLFNSDYSGEDPYKLSASGTLMSLDEYMGELADTEYFKVLLDAGIQGEHQYFLPLSWNILQAYSTQERIEEKGYDHDLYTAIVTESDILKDDENFAISSLQLNRADVLNYFLEVTGNQLFDGSSNELTDNKEEIQQTAECVKVIYDNLGKIRNISTKYRNDFSGSVSHFTYLIEDYPFMHNLRFYETLYPALMGEKMYFTPFTQMDSEDVTAQIIQYGAINANSKNADAAWKLLKYMLDMPASMDFSKYKAYSIYFAPVNIAAYEACVEELNTNTCVGPGRKVGPLTDENKQILIDMPERVKEGVIPNSVLGTIIQECMEPYLLGNDSFDNCYETLMQRLGLYLNE